MLYSKTELILEGVHPRGAKYKYFVTLLEWIFWGYVPVTVD